MLQRMRHFIQVESLSGLILFASAILALIVSNTELQDEYLDLVHLPISIRVGAFELDKFLIKWVNDGLMALFFLILTLEAKFHLLAEDRQARANLPLAACAAVGGVLGPVVCYLWLAGGDPAFSVGWAIPIATDTAFVLGILSFLSNKVPTTARIFILHLSIVDDVIAVLCLALFYTPDLQVLPLLAAGGLSVVLGVLNRLRVHRLSLYLCVGAALWVALMESGVHGTLAGVILGIFVPNKIQIGNRVLTPAKNLEKRLHPFVAFIVLPLFAFLNSGISLRDMNWEDLSSPLTLGVTLGLLVGKQLGIMLGTWIYLVSHRRRLPHGLGWQQFYGLSVLCGVGFTFSLFIGVLSFQDLHLVHQAKMGVMLGSGLAALWGTFILVCCPNAHVREDQDVIVS